MFDEISSTVWYLFTPLIFLLLGRFNHILIELIFRASWPEFLLWIFLSSCLFPVFFWLSDNFFRVENLIGDKERDEEAIAVKEALPYFPSFFSILLTIKLVQMSELEFLIPTNRLKAGIISLNYAFIVVIIIYTQRKEFGEEKIDKVMKWRKKIKFL